MSSDDYLFAKYDFRAVLDNAPAALKKRIEELNDTQLFDAEQEKLLAGLVAAHVIDVPVLDVESTQPAEREVQVDVSGDPRRFIHDRGQPFYVKATEVSFRVPYKGDADVFRCRPSTYSLNPPRADVESAAIVVRVVREDQNAAEYRNLFDRTIAQIQEALKQLRCDCAALENTLKQCASEHLAKRREKRAKDRGLIEGMGFGKSTKG